MLLGEGKYEVKAGYSNSHNPTYAREITLGVWEKTDADSKNLRAVSLRYMRG